MTTFQPVGSLFTTDKAQQHSAGLGQNKIHSKIPEEGLLKEGTIPGLAVNAWEQEKLKQTFPTLQEDVSCDVCVVGGGVAGLNLAYQLGKAGKNVVVVEAKCIGSGQTGRTSAHIMEWNDDFYHEILSHWGVEKTQHMARAQREGVQFYADVCHDLQLDCKFERKAGYLFPADNTHTHTQLLDKELEACHKLRMTQVQKVDLGGGSEVGGIGKALIFPNCADLHPLMYLQQLAHKLTQNYSNIHIYENSRMSKYEADKAHARVHTHNGRTISCDRIVMCTSSPINRNLLVHSRQEAYRSYVVGMRVAKNTVRNVQFWDTLEDYHYVRLEHKEDCDVLVVGGEDHQCGQDPTKYHDSWAQLEKWTRARFPMCQDVMYRWSGMVYEPVDLLHLYGLNPGDSSTRVYIATGDSGQGWTGSAIASVVLSNHILGKGDPYGNIFDPARIPPVSLEVASDLLNESAVVARSFAELVFPKVSGPTRDIEDLAAGSGIVTQRGLHKVAAYRDVDGKLHAHSAVCTHMKCLIRWNPNERCFDCPCHGSQFDGQGRCINGPANKGLDPMDETTLS